ncbi:MAG: hypothetical protein K6G24_11865 [Lachnospiraceae bacterium]|nr:hypothetical protein [Lachnospiraceae bacterium]
MKSKPDENHGSDPVVFCFAKRFDMGFILDESRNKCFRDASAYPGSGEGGMIWKQCVIRKEILFLLVKQQESIR